MLCSGCGRVGIMADSEPHSEERGDNSGGGAGGAGAGAAAALPAATGEVVIHPRPSDSTAEHKGDAEAGSGEVIEQPCVAISGPIRMHCLVPDEDGVVPPCDCGMAPVVLHSCLAVLC